MTSLKLHALFDRTTSTLTYIVWDQLTSDAVVIDPVADYDPATRMVSHRGLVEDFIRAKHLRVHWVLETHAHADHLSGARALLRRWPHAQWGMSERMHEVFDNFRRTFAWPRELSLSSLKVSRFFRDGEEFRAGSLRFRALSTPGHTPACLTYQIGEWLFTGDLIMMPDSGTGRCDFPGGSAAALYDSIWRKIYSLPDRFHIFVGHDYQPGGRPLRYQTTVGAEKAGNIHLREGTSLEEFVKFREARDKTLSPPRLLDVSLDWNLGAHQLVAFEL